VAVELDLTYKIEVDTAEADPKLQKLDQSFEQVELSAEELSRALKVTGNDLRKINTDVISSVRSSEQYAGAVRRLDREFDTVDRSVRKLDDDVRKLDATKKRAASTTNTFSASTSRLGGTIARFVSAAVIGSAIRQTANYADRLEETARQIGFNVVAYQKLSFAASQNGVSTEKLTSSISRLQDNIAGGNKSAVRALQSMGLSLQYVRNLKPEDQFKVIAERIAAIPDPMQRAKVAMDLFGRSGASLLPVITSNIEEIGNKAPVMSEKTVKAMGDANDAFDRLKATAMTLLANGLTPVAEWFSQAPQSAQAAALGLAAMATIGAPALTFVRSLATSLAGLRVALLSIAATPAGGILLGLAAGAGLGHLLAQNTIAKLESRKNIGQPLPGRNVMSTDDPRVQELLNKPFTAGSVTLGPQLGMSRTDMLGNLLSQMREDLNFALNSQQRSVIREFREVVSPTELAEMLEVPELAVKRYIDSLNDLTKAARAADAAREKARKAYEQAAGDLLRLEAARPLKSLDGIGRTLLRNPEVDFMDPFIFAAQELAMIRRGVPDWIDNIGFKFDPLPKNTAAELAAETATMVANSVRDAFQFFAGALSPALASLLGGVLNSFVKAASAPVIPGQQATGLQNFLAKNGTKIAAGLDIAMTGFGAGFSFGQSFGKGKGALAGAATGAVSGAIAGSVVPGIGTVGGLIIGGAAGLFGGWLGGAKKQREEREQMEAARQALIDQHGTIQALGDAAQRAGVDVTKLFSTNNLEEFNMELRKVTGALELRKGREELRKTFGDFERLRSAARRLGMDVTVLLSTKDVGEFRAELERLNEAFEAQRIRIEALNTAAEALNARTAVLADQMKEGKLTTDQAAKAFENLSVLAYGIFRDLVRETGNLLAAMKAISPAIQQLRELAKKFGLEGTAAFQFLNMFDRLIQKNPDVVAALEADLLMLEALRTSGGLTQELFNALGSDLVLQFELLRERGVSMNQAFLLMQPSLQALWEAQQKFGFSVDAATQKLLDQAKAAGFIGDEFLPDSAKLILALGEIRDVLRDILVALGGVEKKARDAGDAMRDIPPPPPAPGTGTNPPTGGQTPPTPSPTGPPTQPPPGSPPTGPLYHAGGRVLDFSRALRAHSGLGLRSDEVPIVAQRGEFVMSRAAVNRVGLNTLDTINRDKLGPYRDDWSWNLRNRPNNADLPVADDDWRTGRDRQAGMTIERGAFTFVAPPGANPHQFGEQAAVAFLDAIDNSGKGRGKFNLMVKRARAS
jgi:hypothetical protein